MVKTYGQLYLDTRKKLLLTEDEHSASYTARQIVCHVSEKSYEQLLADRDLYASEQICAGVDFMAHRILTGEPLAYILGEWEFFGLPLYVDKNVLIPRDDTCAVASLAIQQSLFLHKKPRILDLCTGSGCIGLAIAHKVRDAKVTLGDISQEALAVAKKNILRNKMGNRVSCMQINALEKPSPFLGEFDMVVSNPPYITTQEMKELPNSVKDFEPHLALHGGDDGLIFYRSIAENFKTALKSGGFLCFEFGMGQGDAVCAILKENGFTILERTKDYNNIERAVLAQLDRKDCD